MTRWNPPETRPSCAGLYDRRYRSVLVGRSNPVVRHHWTGSDWQAGSDWSGAFCPQAGFEWRAIAVEPKEADSFNLSSRKPNLYPPSRQSRAIDAAAAAFWSSPLP